MVSNHVKKHKARSSAFTVQLIECALVAVLFSLSFNLAGKLIYNNGFPFGWIEGALMYVMMSAVAIILLGANRYFSFISRPFPESAAKIIALVLVINFIFIALLYFSRSIRLSPYYFIVADTFQILFLILIKRFSGLLKTGILRNRASLVIGGDREENELIRELRKQGVERLAFVSYGDEKLKDYVDRADNIYLSGILSKKLKDRIISYCVLKDKKVFIVPETYEIAMRKSEMTQIGDIPLFAIESFRLTESQNIIKRMMDIVLSVTGILLTLPIMLFAAIQIKLEDGGPVFYRQVRLGQNGKEFKVVKFRSMITDAEKDTGAVFAVENDHRITRIGRLIRASRIDEIPQFFNVLLGSMSIIGPRPERPQFVETFSEVLPEYSSRLAVKPGITGLAQVMGNYTTSAENKVKFDLVYIRDYSILLDIKILFRTIKVIFTKSQSEGFSTKGSGSVYALEAEPAFENSQFIGVKKAYRNHRFGKVVLVLFCSLIIIFGCMILRYSALTTAMLEAAAQPVSAQTIVQPESEGITALPEKQNMALADTGTEQASENLDSTPATTDTDTSNPEPGTQAETNSANQADIYASANISTEAEMEQKSLMVKPETGAVKSETKAVNPESKGEIVLSPEEINTALKKMSIGKKLSVAYDLISRLSAADLMTLDKLAGGGLTAEEKVAAKEMMYQYFNDAEVEYIKEIYWEYVK